MQSGNLHPKVVTYQTDQSPVGHQPMMLLIRGSRKSATLACPRRFLCPLHPMSPMSLATLRAQRYSHTPIVSRAIGSLAIVSNRKSSHSKQSSLCSLCVPH